MVFNCLYCNSLWVRKTDYISHCATAKHKRKELANNEPVQNSIFCSSIVSTISNDNFAMTAIDENKPVSGISRQTPDGMFSCATCNYHTKYPKDLKKHLNSKKHKNNMDSTYDPTQKRYTCNVCNKVYINKYCAFWAHRKKCKPVETPVPTAGKKDSSVTELIDGFCIDGEKKNVLVTIINKLFIENQELRNFVVEQSKEHAKQFNEYKNDTKELVTKMIELSNTGLSNITNNNIHNTVNEQINHTVNEQIHNTVNGNLTANKFNINLFLNDKCKDALNLSDFIGNVHVTSKDLENNAEKGFVSGISKILIDNLRNLSIYERPIHCTDTKRETLYIKEEDQWGKEEDSQKLCDAIQEISRKSLIQFCQWKEENPEYADLDSETGLKYMAISMNSMAGGKREEYYNKVIKAIAKETVIDKKQVLIE